LKSKASEKILAKIDEQAEAFIRMAGKKYNVFPDYSEEALLLVDDLITIFFKIHRDHFIKATVVIGSYFGQTIRKNIGGKWLKDLSLGKVGKLKGFAYPMTRARKRLANGTDDSLVAYYKNLKIATCRDSTFAADKEKIENYRSTLIENGLDILLLTRMLNDHEPRYVREEAAALLGKLARENIADPLVKAAKDPETAYFAAIALQGLPVKKACKPLLRHLKNNLPANVKQQILLALGKMHSPEIVDDIIKYIDDEDEIVGHYAAIALGEIGGSETIDKLLNIMADLHPSKVLHAITALEIMADRRAVPALIEALFSKDEEVREASARALQYIPDERAFNPLVYCLKDKSSRIRIYAAYALANIENQEVLPHINKLLTDDVENVRLHASHLVNWLKNGKKPEAKVI